MSGSSNGPTIWSAAPRERARPLDGVRVLDLSRILAGPYCTMLLADLGCDVVKVEAPAGDETRRWGPPFAGDTAAYFAAANRNKKSVVLDLKSDAGRGELDELLTTADVVVHNFTASVAATLGVDWERVRSLNPAAIYLVISGFGPDEPERRGYDLTAQALGGMMSITGAADGPPMKVGVAVSDLAAALFASSAVTSALYRREQTGSGDHVEVSLYDSTLALLINQAQSYLACQDEPIRRGNEHPSLSPYSVYRASDGDVVIAVGADGQFGALCEVIGCEELAHDPRFATNVARIEHRDALRTIIEQRLARYGAAEWEYRFGEAGVPCGSVRSVSEALEAPEARTVVAIADGSRHVLSPIRIDGELLSPYLAPPELGEHTGELTDGS